MKTKVSLLYSLRDPAGRNMASEISERLGEQFDLRGKSIELVSFEREILYVKSCEELGVSDFDYVVVLSRHSGTPHRPILTAHVPGNFGRAKYGGESFKLGIAIPSLMKEYLVAASKRVEGTGYSVGFEPTHHGPTIEKPIAFLEIGCDEEAWNDPNGIRMAAESVVEALENWTVGKYIPTIAFGGPHVNDHFTRVELKTMYAIGHTARKLDASWVDVTMVRQAIERNGEPPEMAIVDNKGLKGEDRERIETALREIGLRMVRVKKLLREGIEVWEEQGGQKEEV